MNVSVTEDEVGKDVVDQRGEQLGTVVDVDTGTVQFETTEEIDDSGVVRRIQEEGDDVYEVEEQDITEVTGTEVRIDQGE